MDIDASTPGYEDEVLTPDEAAVLLKVSKKTVLRHARAGALPAARVGRAWRFRRSQLLVLLDGTAPPMNGVYLDYNGSSPMDPRVADAMVDLLRYGVGNASSVHSYGRAQASRVGTAREQVAALVGARSRDVVFTAGATEANNLALQGLVESSAEGRTRVLVSAVEHASVRETARWLNAQVRVEVDVIPVTGGGFVDLDALAELLAGDVLVVSVMAANSETGVLNDLGAVAALAHDSGALVHSDATQIVGRLEFDMGSLGVDIASISGHKICGPGGVGALVGSAATARQLRPVIHGGGHENGLRSGSLNVAGIAGFGLAADLANDERVGEATRVGRLRDELVAGIRAALPDVDENGDVARRLPNTANLRFCGADADAVMVNLDGLAVSTGSACSAGTIEPSPVLTAMGLDRAAADESIRFSLGRFTTRQEITEATIRAIGAVRYVRSMHGST